MRSAGFVENAICPSLKVIPFLERPLIHAGQGSDPNSKIEGGQEQIARTTYDNGAGQ